MRKIKYLYLHTQSEMKFTDDDDDDKRYNTPFLANKNVNVDPQL